MPEFKPVLYMLQESSEGPRLVKAQKVGRNSYESVKENDAGEAMFKLKNNDAEEVTIVIPKDFNPSRKSEADWPVVKLELGPEDSQKFHFVTQFPPGARDDSYFKQIGKQGTNVINRFLIRDTKVDITHPKGLEEAKEPAGTKK